MKPIPDNVADILNQLSGPHQVALRSYIATLRAEIRQFEEDLHAQEDADPHAHYHGASPIPFAFGNGYINSP
jgi:hypothetical protein